MTQIAYNSSKNATTEFTPFFTNYRKESNMQRIKLPMRNLTNKAIEKASLLHKLHE